MRKHNTLTRPVTVLSAVTTMALGLVMLPGAVPAQAHGQDGSTEQKVVATGLDNPRGLSFGRNGLLYVGEAGHAGPLCIGAGETGPECIGQTSLIGSVDVRTGRHRTVVGGLISVGSAVASTGVDGVSAAHGRVYGIITGSPGGVPASPCAGSTVADCQSQVDRALSQLGNLIVTNGHGYRTVAGVGAFDYLFVVSNKAALDANNPDFAPGDANPYGVLKVSGGTYVVDAGSNTLDFVNDRGEVRVLRTDDGKPVYLPNPPGPADQRFPYDSVPTCVVKQGDNVIMGTLSGELWRYDGHTLVQVANRSDGLTAINGCAVARNGDVIVSNIFGATPDTLFTPNTGSVMKVTADGAVSTLAQGLNFPAGVAVDRHGRVYVAINSVCPKDLDLVGPADPPFCQDTGAVLRLAS
jgi:hypothetical protein